MDAIDKKMQDVEYKLISRADALSDDKYFRDAISALHEFHLAERRDRGRRAATWRARGDYGPTETGTALVLDLERQLQAVQAEYKSLMDKDVPAYNKSITGSGVAPLQTTGAPPPPAPPGWPRRRKLAIREAGAGSYGAPTLSHRSLLTLRQLLVYTETDAISLVSYSPQPASRPEQSLGHPPFSAHFGNFQTNA